tara:strand:- start:340 stop:525 length:186 start_codon:yes stop_codon:yes gene_type:complete
MSHYYFLEHQKLDGLIELFNKQGYQVKAPAVRDEAIVYDDIESADELPWGYIDEQLQPITR